MRRWIGIVIWELSEGFGIGLGKWAPIIFGWKIGFKGKRVEM